MTPEERKIYDRAYRQKNRDRIREVRRAWRADNRSKVTTSENERKKRRLAEYKSQQVELPDRVPLFGHDLYDSAIQVVGSRTGTLTTLYDPIYEDYISVVILALLEHKCPETELRAFKKSEYSWRYFVVGDVTDQTILDMPMVLCA